MKQAKRLLSLAMCAVLVLGMVPVPARAAEPVVLTQSAPEATEATEAAEPQPEGQNYKELVLEGTFVIKPKTVTVSPKTGTLTKTYDGTVTANIELELEDVIGNEDVKATYTNAYYIDSDETPTANCNEAVKIRVTGIGLEGADMANYIFAEGYPLDRTYDGTITPKNINECTLTLDKTDLVYSGKLQTQSVTVTDTIGDETVTLSAQHTDDDGDYTVTGFTVTYDGFVNDETESVLTPGTVTTNYKQGDDRGTYDIIPSGYQAANYDITYGNGKLTVARKVIGIQWSNTSLTYNGKDQKPVATATGVLDGDDVYLAVEGAKSNTGTHTATIESIQGNDANNYDLPESGLTTEFTIGEATPSITKAPTPKDLVYSGSPMQVGTGGTAKGGKIWYKLERNGQTVSDYSRTLPMAKEAGTYTVTYKVVGDPNYTDLEDASFTFDVTIAPCPLDVTLTAKPKTYDGTTAAEVEYESKPFSGDTVTVTGATAVFDDPNAGVQSVTFDTTGLTLDNPNYRIDQSKVTKTPTATITKAATEAQFGVKTIWNRLEKTYELDLSNLLFSLDAGKTYGNVSYSLVGTPNLGVYADSADIKIEGSKLILPVKWINSDTTAEFRIDIGIQSENYTIADTYYRIVVANKENAAITGLSAAPDPVYNGHPQSGVTGKPTVPGYTGDFVVTYDGANGTEYGPTAEAPVNAGSYRVTYALPETHETLLGEVTIPFAIGKATATVTALDVTASQDEAMPAFGYKVEGLMGSDKLITEPDFTCDADMSVSGDFAIVPANADAGPNYTIAYVNGTLTVREKFNITVIIDKISDKRLNSVIGDHVQTETVTIDFSELKQNIDTVILHVETVRQIAEAANDKDNDTESLEIKLPGDISIEFQAEALAEKVEQAKDRDITISIQPSYKVKTLTKEQKQQIGKRPAYSVTVMADGEYITNLGGEITISVPYQLKQGEKAEGLRVYYVDDQGSREACETEYDSEEELVSWKTDHLSLYVIAYEE